MEEGGITNNGKAIYGLYAIIFGASFWIGTNHNSGTKLIQAPAEGKTNPVALSPRSLEGIKPYRTIPNYYDDNLVANEPRAVFESPDKTRYLECVIKAYNSKASKAKAMDFGKNDNSLENFLKGNEFDVLEITPKGYGINLKALIIRNLDDNSASVLYAIGDRETRLNEFNIIQTGTLESMNFRPYPGGDISNSHFPYGFALINQTVTNIWDILNTNRNEKPAPIPNPQIVKLTKKIAV